MARQIWRKRFQKISVEHEWKANLLAISFDRKPYGYITILVDRSTRRQVTSISEGNPDFGVLSEQQDANVQGK
ncbi:hypothetical protein ASF79_09595 [Agreia sp. Leaf335]|uniref:hypothetical protein n=1 Tax=Agreia sp. Leaf335 TaxID=1736340 RepID=UPI0006F489B3|nr:hypothetical protein [Agreia sp. Leaf335]KQR22477.1 hypothetical protein ASF79_09595 [Agreia sp. Leaf335]